jgi:hypothetical protein
VGIEKQFWLESRIKTDAKLRPMLNSGNRKTKWGGLSQVGGRYIEEVSFQNIFKNILKT